MSAHWGSRPEGTGEVLGRARALLPALAAAAPEIERGRRIPPGLLRAIHDARLYRMLLPRSVGGEEADPLTFLSVLELIAGAEASTAWNLCQNSVCATVAAYLDPAAAREIFGAGDAVLAWGPQTGETRARSVQGGYRVTGAWSFASGGRHATWLGGQCPVEEAGGALRLTRKGSPELRTMLFPAASATFTDVWDVIGLRGTASDAFAVQDLFVPEAFSVVRDEVAQRREGGRLYRFTTLNLFAPGFASIALGAARAMLDAFVRLAQEKTPRASASLLRDNAEVQSDVGQAEAHWRAARALLRGTIAEIWEAVGASAAEGLTMDQRVAIRMAATHAIRTARDVAGMAYDAAGATAVFAGNPYEKPFRDIHTIAQQVQGRKTHFQSVGKFLLGLEPETAFL